jgi:hypothetical protein
VWAFVDEVQGWAADMTETCTGHLCVYLTPVDPDG